MLMDPESIKVLENRQRKTPADIEPLARSINKVGQIHPIVVRRNGEDVILVVGEGRLLSCRKLKREVEVKFLDDLTPLEAEIIELEENAKRTDLPWREHVGAAGRIHEIYMQMHKGWTGAKTAEEISLSTQHFGMLLTVYKNLNSPLLKDCTNIKQAFSILQTVADRQTAEIVTRISSTGTKIFAQGTSASTSTSIQTPSDQPPSDSDQPLSSIPVSGGPKLSTSEPAPLVLNVDFAEWAKTYAGPKFTLIHCDFPYDVEYRSYAASRTASDSDYDAMGYWPLIDVLCDNLDRIASYSCHMMFWFSMKFYQRTKDRLEQAGLFVHEHPLIWLKSDNSGIIPGTDNIYPRRIYETALLCSRGKRPLVKQLANGYAAPMAANALHPSQKPEPMLRHFMSMLVDETTDMLDPTCGSGSSLRAADSIGARSVLGLELSPEYAKAAEAATQTARKIRKALEA